MTVNAKNARPKVVLVGPILPFRGGIGQHTTFVARELDKMCDLHTISFKRQYPRVLYPGISDRDPDAPDAGLKSVEFSIDSVNPLSWVRAISRIRSFKPDMVIIPMWTFFLAPCLGIIARGCRGAGIEVRIISHNAVDHEAAFWKRAILRWAREPAKTMVAQSRVDRDFLRQIHPNALVSAFPHPVHTEFPDPVGTLPRRARIELLFFGLVRFYKGLDVLLAALPDLGDLDWHLSVVGEFWEGREETEELIRDLNVGQRVELIAHYVSNNDAARFFSRADIVVLPYRSATGSGVIPLAYRYGKPVIVSHLGGLSDMVDDELTGLLIPPEDSRAIANSIRRLAESERDYASLIARKKAAMSWSRLALHVISAFDPEFSASMADENNISVEDPEE